MMMAGSPVWARVVVCVLVVAMSASGSVAHGKSWCCLLLHQASQRECCQGCHTSHVQHAAEEASSCCTARALQTQAQPICQCQSVSIEWAALVGGSWQSDLFVPHFTAYVPALAYTYRAVAESEGPLAPDVPVRVLFCTWLN